MFGALRRLLMSGDIAGVLQGSRRAFQDLVMGSPVPNEASRARALEGMNERGGFSDPSIRDVFRRNPPRGVTMDQGTTPAYTLPGEWPRYNYRTARGYPGVYDTAGPVSRSYYAGPTSSEIVAPYEGFRVWPQFNSAPPGPWMGAGMPPTYQSFPAGQGFESIYSPSPSWQTLNFNVPRAFGGMYDGWNG